MPSNVLAAGAFSFWAVILTFLSTFVRVVADIFANIVSNRIFDIFKNGALYEKKGFIRASDTSCRRIFGLRRGASFQQIPPGADQPFRVSAEYICQHHTL